MNSSLQTAEDSSAAALKMPKETSGLVSGTPNTSPAISGRVVSHWPVLLSDTRNKTMAFIFLS